MQNELLTRPMLLAKAKETGIAFANLLGGAVLEETVRRIGELKQGEQFLLKGRAAFGQEQYVKKLVLALEYDVIPFEGEEQEADAFLQNLAQMLREEVFEGNDGHGIFFSQTQRQMKNRLQLELLAELDGMHVPVSVNFNLLHGYQGKPLRESFFCMMFPQEAAAYSCHQPEDVLAGHFVEIITKMELIINIGIYYEIFVLLGSGMRNGRQIAKAIGEECNRRGIEKAKSRMERVAGYGTSAHMKKKWKAFLRSVHESGPTWEDALGRFLKFYGPIWDAVCGDYVFIGDWMPEFGRYF